MRFSSPASQFLLIALSAAVPASNPDASLTPKQIADSSTPAVVQLLTEGKDEDSQTSGFVVERSGLIVTNLHALDKATKVTVSLADGKRFEEVAVLAFDIEQDLAIVKIDVPDEGEGLTTAELGESASVRPGDPIVVISNPLGLSSTVTEGIVSAWREPREDTATHALEDRAPLLPLPTRSLLQISAAISPGSSGGPVFSERGKVVGIAVAGVLYGMADLNFAVPVDDVPRLLRQESPMDLPTFHRQVERARLDLARPYFERGQLAFDQGEVKTARKHLDRALLLFPDYESALTLSGRIRMEAGDLGQAERFFLRAVEADEESADAWYRLGSLYDLMASDNGSLSMMSRAQAAYERCLALDAAHAHAAYGLAVLHLRRGNLAEAEDLLRRASESDAAMVDAQSILGLILLERGQVGEAEDLFRRAIWENAGHALAYFGLAQVLMGREETRRTSATYWQRFLELSRDDPSLAKQREIALRIVERWFPSLVVR